MAVCFNNGTSFTGTNASHVINFNGTSMCTVVDNDCYIKFDRQSVCANQITPARRTGYGYSYAYCNYSYLYYWSGSCWYLSRCFQTRFLNFTGGSLSTGCFRACYDHTYPVANMRNNCVRLCDYYMSNSCILIPTCCGVTCINLSRSANTDLVQSWQCQQYSFYLGANTYSCTVSYSPVLTVGNCVRRSYVIGPNAYVWGGCTFTDCRGTQFKIIGAHIGNYLTSATMNSCVNHSSNFVPTSCLRSREIPHIEFFSPMWCSNTNVCPVYAAFLNAQNMPASCYRIGTVCAWTSPYCYCTCARGNSWQCKQMGSWYGACI